MFGMFRILQAIFSWHAVVGVATIALVGSEILKYDYETTKGAVDTVWRFNERLDGLRNARACTAFISRWDAFEENLQAITELKPIKLKSLDGRTLALFERCVKDAADEAKLDNAMTAEGVEVSRARLLELRLQMLSLVNAYDLTLASYKSVDVNKSVVCENMVGFFVWHDDGKPQKSQLLKVLEVYIRQNRLSSQEYANLVPFLKQIENGECPRPEFVLQGFTKKVYTATATYIDQILRFFGART
jgi:hypothetical protein